MHDINTRHEQWPELPSTVRLGLHGAHVSGLSLACMASVPQDETDQSLRLIT
jgi:hypothetical protein